MKHKILSCLLVAAFIASAAGTGCGRRYAKGKYIDPNTIILRSDKFVDSDLKIIADRLTGSLLANSAIASLSSPPPVLISRMTNSTDEHIDMNSLSEKIQVTLYKSGRFRFINAKLRDAIEGEHRQVEGGFVDPSTAKMRGRQTGAHYLISGNISSIKQPVGRQEIVYYKATLELTDLESNLISWMDEVEIKKQFKKRYTGF